jgi:hypothetical protein
MATFREKFELTSWGAGILSALVCILALIFAWYSWKHPADSSTTPPAAQVVQHSIDAQLAAQSFRTSAISFRSLASSRLANTSDEKWLAAESDFKMANDSYARGEFAEAATYFDNARRAYNDIYSNFEVAPRNSAAADRVARLEAYIRKLDAEIKDKNEERIRSAPIEAGAPNDRISNSIEAQLADLHALRSQAERQLIQVMAQQ